MLAAARAWAARLKRQRPEVRRLGIFGSYVRGDHVPGSDLDVLIEVEHTPAGRRLDRADAYRPAGFPVGTDIFVYTSGELAALRQRGSAFLRAAEAHMLWLDDTPSPGWQ